MYIRSTETFQKEPMEILIHIFLLTSPEMVANLAISGRLDFNPITDTMINDKGEAVKLNPPLR